jgi:hypothetical protein
MAPPNETERKSSLLATFRHPLVVGAALTLLSAGVASLLVPALTRVWQDRPKELALKQSLVENISRSTTEALEEAKFYLFVEERGGVAKGNRAYIRMTKPWQVESSIITGQLRTYFRGSSLEPRWLAYAEAVREYEFASAFYGVRETAGAGSFAASLQRLRAHFRRRRFSGSREKMRRRFLGEPTAFDALAYEAPLLFFQERDDLAAGILDAPARGFSHGWWIFK